jgi:hypothetical protein
MTAHRLQFEKARLPSEALPEHLCLPFEGFWYRGFSGGVCRAYLSLLLHGSNHPNIESTTTRRTTVCPVHMHSVISDF